MRPFKLLTALLWLALPFSGFCQLTATSSIATGQESWNTGGAWTFSVGFSPFEGYPNNDFDEDSNVITPATNVDYGAYIVIDVGDNIEIPNNTIIDLSNSRLISITLKTNAELHFGSNAKLIMPSGSKIIFENGAKMMVDNNSNGTYLEIGDKPIWGRACAPTCNNNTLTGPGYIDENSNPASPMPVELLFFRAEVSEAKKVNLTWATASEKNADFFSVQRSVDGKEFEEVAQVKAAGNSVQRVDYTFADERPLIGRSYYRLKQIDFDGAYEYFNIRYVDLIDKKSMILYPNPVAGSPLHVQLNFTAETPVRVRIINSIGVEVRNFTFSGLACTIPLTLETGTYLLRAQVGNDEFTSRFMVE